MTNTFSSPACVSSLTNLADIDLLAEVARVAACERRTTAHLVALLAELDSRRLYLGQGCSSLFTYCTEVLHLSEHAAYNRIQAARAARRFPVILELLAEGSIHLTAVRLLEPHLAPENHRDVLNAARHRGKRAIEELIAQIRPRADVPASVRKLPTPVPLKPSVKEPDAAPAPATFATIESASLPAISAAPAPARPAIVTPLAPERYKVQFTISKATHDKLRRAQDLMRHQIPNGDPEVLFDRALTVLLSALERTKFAAAERPRATAQTTTASRHIPAAIRRAVWSRDDGRCAFAGDHGRCTETGLLEFHHRVPYAVGGASAADNLELRCRAHNAYEAETYFGRGRPLVAGLSPARR